MPVERVILVNGRKIEWMTGHEHTYVLVRIETARDCVVSFDLNISNRMRHLP